MGGLLAVPVAVLLLVLLLALMGRRWTAPAYTTEAEVDVVEDPFDLVDDFEPLPYEPAPRMASMPSTALAPRPYTSGQLDRYESPLDHRYGSLARQQSAVYDPYGTQATAHDGYGSSGELELFGSREVEVYERRDPEPEPEEPRGFPYGPYKYS
jgi:hypothetical protein